MKFLTRVRIAIENVVTDSTCVGIDSSVEFSRTLFAGTLSPLQSCLMVDIMVAATITFVHLVTIRTLVVKGGGES